MLGHKGYIDVITNEKIRMAHREQLEKSIGYVVAVKTDFPSECDCPK